MAVRHEQNRVLSFQGKRCYTMMSNEQRQKWREEVRKAQRGCPYPNLEVRLLESIYSDFRNFIFSSFNLKSSIYSETYWTSVIGEYSSNY